METHVVLGAGFGDEGKGNFVNYLCSIKKNPIVIRFSGGQQAGHTVINNGLKHVFSNYGSGTLRNVPSYLTHHCCFYLNTMFNERDVLLQKGITPILYVHPMTLMTTPADIAFSRIRDKILTHGTCGLGIGTTMTRNETSGYKLFAIDLLHKGMLLQKLDNIKKYYLGLVLAYNNADFIIEFNEYYDQAIIQFSDIINNWKTDPLFEMYDYSKPGSYSTLIFEGSQGILLDASYGIFPNVTYANTTCENIMEILSSNQLRNMNSCQMYYITRGYQTRHGNGWMSSNEPVVLKNTEQEINVYNEWQGNFKTTILDHDLLEYSINVNKVHDNDKLFRHNIVYTCLDQLEIIPELQSHGCDNIYVSYSPESTKISKLNK